MSDDQPSSIPQAAARYRQGAPADADRQPDHRSWPSPPSSSSSAIAFSTCGESAPPPPPHSLAAALPAGAKVLSSAVGDGHIVLTVEVDGAIELRSFDLNTLKPLGRAVLTPKRH